VNPATAESLRRAAAHVLVDDVAVPELDDDAAHHLFRVLRVRAGDAVSVTDGTGRWRVCRAGHDRIDPVTPASHEDRGGAEITLVVAIPKHDRPEWIVQKLTELGVARIVFIHAERSVVRWSPERATKHLPKLRRVAAQALQQSRGLWLPVVEGPVDAASVLPRSLVAEPGARPVGPGDRTIAIGPEGGWSTDELANAAGQVSLGQTVLRVETAAITAAVLAILHSA
jgi:16S rRNA (uracil1498-N3)-methyltransferase